MHDDPEKSYEELKILKKVDRVEKTCENAAPKQRCAAISLEEATDGIETREDLFVSKIRQSKQLTVTIKFSPTLN